MLTIIVCIVIYILFGFVYLGYKDEDEYGDKYWMITVLLFPLWLAYDFGEWLRKKIKKC